MPRFLKLLSLAALAAVLPALSAAARGANVIDNLPYSTYWFSDLDPLGFSTLESATGRLAAAESFLSSASNSTVTVNGVTRRLIDNPIFTVAQGTDQTARASAAYAYSPTNPPPASTDATARASAAYAYSPTNPPPVVLATNSVTLTLLSPTASSPSPGWYEVGVTNVTLKDIHP